MKLKTYKPHCCKTRKEGPRLALEIIVGVVALIVLGVVITSLPELKRYLRIRRM
jgi:hypothetical protein